MSDPTQNPRPESNVPPWAEQPSPPPEPPGAPTTPRQDPYAQPGGGPYGVPPYPTGYAGEPGYGTLPDGAGQPPELFMRFLARVIDNILLGIVSAIISAIVATIFSLPSTSYGYGLGASYASAAISGVIGAVIALAYFALMESRSGQTIGKRVLRLRTVGPDGSPPSLEEALRRNFWVALGALAVIPFLGAAVGAVAELVIVIVIAVTIGRSPIGQGWHDRFAGGTRVVRTR